MKKILCFDMDGTLADLYGVGNWLDMLENRDSTVFEKANPMIDMALFRMKLNELKQFSYEVAIITWLPMNANKDYKKECKKRKKEWLEKYQVPYNSAHYVQYGTQKSRCIKMLEYNESILFDDNASVLSSWRGTGKVDVKKRNIIEVLDELIEREVVKCQKSILMIKNGESEKAKSLISSLC